MNLVGGRDKVGAGAGVKAGARVGAGAGAGARVKVRRKGLEELLEPLPVAARRQAASPRMAGRQACLAPHRGEGGDLRLA